MPFGRELSESFIAKLNQHYADENSWWRTLVADKDVFLAIRQDAINAYVRGQSIARIEFNRGRMKLLVSPKFLVIPKAGNAGRVDLLNPGRQLVLAECIQNQHDYAQNFASIKGAIKYYSEPEREAENQIALGLQNGVLDMEVAISDDAVVDETADAIRSEGGRFDLVMVDPSGCLKVVEIKCLANRELRRASDGHPALVCRQLENYHAWLTRNGERFLAECQQARSGLRKLHGVGERFAAAADPNNVDVVPRLLIIGFKDSDRKLVGNLKAEIVTDMREIVPQFSAKHLHAVGIAGNVGLMKYWSRSRISSTA